MADINFIGLKELKAAIKRSPQKVLDEARMFLTRGLAQYKAGIIKSPWRIKGPGGGSPVSNDPRYPRRYQRQRSGNLRDSHTTRINGLQGIIGPNQRQAPYAKYVHDGTRRMQGRPWLDHVQYSKKGDIERLYKEMLKKIVGDMAK
jgi:hypothetical protein